MAKPSLLARSAQVVSVSHDGFFARVEQGAAGSPADIGSQKKSGQQPGVFDPGGCFRPQEEDAVRRTRRQPPRKKSEAAALFERHQGRSGNRDELLLELYYSNLSVAGAEEAARLMWGGGAGVALIGEEARKIVRRLDLWLRRALPVPQLGVFVQSVRVKRTINGRTKPIELFVAVGAAADGSGEVLAVCASNGPEDNAWNRLMAGLQKRGLRGTSLFAGPNEPAACEAVARYFPRAKYQGDLAQLQRDTLWMVPVPAVDSLLKAFACVRACKTLPAASAQAARLVEELRGAGEFSAAMFLERMFSFQFGHYDCAPVPGMRVREGNPLSRPLHELRRWLRQGGPVGDERALVLMAAARLRQVFGPAGM